MTASIEEQLQQLKRANDELLWLMQRSNQIITQYLRTDASMDMRLHAREHLERCMRAMGVDEATIAAMPHPMDQASKSYPPFQAGPD